MNKEFIPYEQALELKELGFNEKCLTSYNSKKELVGVFDTALQDKFVEVEDCFVFNSNVHTSFVAAPLYQQAFRWFREKHDIFPLIETNIKNLVGKKWFFSIGHVKGTWELVTSHETYEEAELACLKKLIEIAKNKPQKEGRIQDISIG